MNLLYVGKNSKDLQRIKSICRDVGFTVNYAESGYEALNEVQLVDYKVVMVGEGQDVVKSPQIIKRLLQQNKSFFTIPYIKNDKISNLYQYLSHGSDRWILRSQTDNEIGQYLSRLSEQNYNFKKIDRLRFQLKQRYNINNLIGGSMKISSTVYTMLERLIRAELAVFIQGESGSGKELVAHLIHMVSPREKQKFVSMNCAAIPKELMESELFGFEKGAFTGAHKQKKGKFEFANRGTLFLDEIGDMEMALQSKILRVIEQQQFERIGNNESISTDVRIISATNIPIDKAIADKKFRMDLYYRINSFAINIPPLRERKDDILPLFVHFIHHLNRKNDRNIETYDLSLIKVLSDYSWPGNVREFENILARSVLFSEGTHLKMDVIAEILNMNQQIPRENKENRELELPQQESSTRIKSIADLEKDAIIHALKVKGGNVSVVAKELGLSRVTVWRKIEKYNLKQFSSEMRAN